MLSFKNILKFALFSTLFLSCDDDLNVEANDSIKAEDFVNQPGAAESLVNGTYATLLDYSAYSFSWIGLTSITSDDADKGSTPGDFGSDKNLLDDLNFSSSMVSVNDVWNARYKTIYRANTALFYFDKISALDIVTKNRYIGEIKFIRALAYFDLVRCFGGVPIVTQRIEDVNNTELINQIVYTRKSKQEVYQLIENDLLDATQKLPLKSVYSINDLGRATKGSAQGLLSKVYLYQEKWQEAFDMSNEVISSNQYGLLDDYASVWREVGENSKESVFEIQAVAGNGIVEYSDVQSPRGNPDLGWGFNTPSDNLENTYQSGDSRKAATILYRNGGTLWDGFVCSPGWNNPKYNYKAYHSSLKEDWNDNKANTGKNLRIIKYSDILLINAEAAFKLGNIQIAIDNVNLTRNRAGLADLSSLSLDELYKERRLEMAMEHDRWFDLIRTGKALSAMSAVGKTFLVGIHEVFPIPAQVIVQSGGRISQNNGY